MGMTEQIRILLVKNFNMSEAELARQLKTTPQNLNAKMRKDKFSVEDLQKIADVLGYTLDIKFVKKK